MHLIWGSSYNDPIETNIGNATMNNLKRLCNKRPKIAKQNQIEITQNEFDAILTDSKLIVVEKHFHQKLETQQVLFVIKDNEIANVYVKHIIGDTTRIYKGNGNV